MQQFTILFKDKETDNKLRWIADIDGVEYKLYIPKSRVPDPPPCRLKVELYPEGTEQPEIYSANFAKDADNSSPIICVIEKYEKVGHTARYRPTGNPDTWEIGEPYIPYSLLGKPVPERLIIKVTWDYSEGNWIL